MSDTDSDIEVLTTKPSTSQVPAIRVNNNKGKGRAEVLSILSSEDDDALPDIAPPARKYTAMPAKKAMSSKAAAMLAKIGEATRSDPESEDDSGIKLLDRSGSSSSAEQPKAKPSKRNREVSDDEDDVLPNVGAGRKSKTASLEEIEASKAKPAPKKVRQAELSFEISADSPSGSHELECADQGGESTSEGISKRRGGATKAGQQGMLSSTLSVWVSIDNVIRTSKKTTNSPVAAKRLCVSSLSRSLKV